MSYEEEYEDVQLSPRMEEICTRLYNGLERISKSERLALMIVFTGTMIEQLDDVAQERLLQIFEREIERRRILLAPASET